MTSKGGTALGVVVVMAGLALVLAVAALGLTLARHTKAAAPVSCPTGVRHVYSLVTHKDDLGDPDGYKPIVVCNTGRIIEP